MGEERGFVNDFYALVPRRHNGDRRGCLRGKQVRSSANSRWFVLFSCSLLSCKLQTVVNCTEDVQALLLVRFCSLNMQYIDDHAIGTKTQQSGVSKFAVLCCAVKRLAAACVKRGHSYLQVVITLQHCL